MQGAKLNVQVSHRTEWFLQLAIVAGATIPFARAYGGRRGLRYVLGMFGALAVQEGVLAALMRRVAAKTLSLSDLISISRATCADILAGLVASGVKERERAAGWMGWIAAVWGIASDLLDGKVARYFGETKLSSVLDIECDSWLTFWLAGAAASWGNLPRWCLLPPLLRYAHPLLDLRRGELPVGGGPAWGRLTGGSQTVLLLSALRPLPSDRVHRFVQTAWLPISGGQFLAMLALFFHNRQQRELRAESAKDES